MNKKHLLGIVAGIVTFAALVTPAWADGTYKSHASLKTDFQTMDWNGGKVTVGSLKGIIKIYGSTSAKMPNGDRIQSCLLRVVKMSGGTDIITNCGVTDKDGDVLYSISERKQGDINTGGRGKTTYIGGTGKYAGASGSCEYGASYLPDNWLSVDSDCVVK